VLFLGEWEGVRKDGEPVWLMLTTKLLKNSQGETVGMIGVGKDLTERKKAEEALRKSEEKWRSLAENAPNVIVIVDRVGTIQFINRTVVNARPEEIVGRSVYDFIDPEHHNVVKKTIEQVFQTGEGSRYGISGVGPKGSVAWYETHAGPIKHDGQTVAVTLITTDLTERRKVEQQLRIKETAVASSINGVAFADPEGKLTYVNSSFLEMWGYANENEVLGRPAEDFWSSRENAGEVVKALMHKGGWVGDLTAKKKDGSTFEVQLSASTVKDETGKPSCMMGSFLDVTERRKAGQSLKESEEKYRSLVELAPDGIVAVNAEGVVTSANRSFLTLVGYDSEREIVGKPFTELMTMRKEDIPRFQGMFMSLMKGESPSPSEFLYVRRDGASRWAEVHPGLLIKDGHPVGVQAIMRDVSERKKTEEKLRNSEERLSTLFELAPDAYYLSDLKGNFVDGNKAAEKLTGYMKDELIGKSFMKLKLLPRNEVLKAAKLLAMNALGKSTGPDELVLNRKDGTQVPVEIRTHPIRIKGKTLVLGIARDITTRKKNERAIQESQQRFEGLFRHNPEAAVYLGPDLCIQGINPRFEKLFGYALPEIKGKHIDDVVVPNDKREEAQALDSQAIQGYAHQNTWRRRKNGSPVPVSISAAPIIIEDRLAGYIGIYSDISELRSTQKELEATNEKLRVVGGLTRHDVRNKLSAITGNAYLLKKQLADNKESLDKVRDMETAVSQVTRIFDFAKNYEMLGAEELTYIDVQKSVNEAVQLFQDLKGVRVLNECHGLTVLSDSLLRQLFYNLIDNSLKYGEKLSQIRIHYEKAEGNQLRLVYEDDGVGISQDAKPKLFDEGYTTGKGSGYGLYLIRRIMEVYGWTIQETGAPGKGARFTMVMPERNQNGKENYQLH
jgi:PAS domain S-box-containing protein